MPLTIRRHHSKGREFVIEFLDRQYIIFQFLMSTAEIKSVVAALRIVAYYSIPPTTNAPPVPLAPRITGGCTIFSFIWLDFYVLVIRGHQRTDRFLDIRCVHWYQDHDKKMTHASSCSVA